MNFREHLELSRLIQETKDDPSPAPANPPEIAKEPQPKAVPAYHTPIEGDKAPLPEWLQGAPIYREPSYSAFNSALSIQRVSGSYGSAYFFSSGIPFNGYSDQSLPSTRSAEDPLG